MNLIPRPIEVEVGLDLPEPKFATSPPRRWPIRFDTVGIATIVVDIVTIIAASLLASLLYQIGEGMQLEFGQAVGSAALVSSLFCLLLKSQGLYRPTELMLLRRQLRLIITDWMIVFLILSTTVFALKIGSQLSRVTSLLFAVLGLTALIATRKFLARLLSKGLTEGRFARREIVLITDQENHGDEKLSATLSAFGFDIVRTYVLKPCDDFESSIRRGLIAGVVDYVRGSNVEELVVAADPGRWAELRVLAADLRVLPFPITFIPTGPSSEVFSRPHRHIGETVCMEMQRGPLSAIEHSLKRYIDVIGASVGLVVLIPLLVTVALAIKLDSAGPILFRQRRLGFNGRTFQICKFRTMYVLEDGSSVIQARKYDCRVTRLGKWLRRTSIDELPQLFNVLGGSMSLVGPRPHAVAHEDQFNNVVRNYAFRRRVKPGLTGWAQIHGHRGPTPTIDLVERRVEHDLWYIDNWSLKLDFAILLQTPLELVRGRNAY